MLRMLRGFTIKKGNHALLNDGRRFQIKEINSIFVFENGSISNAFQNISVEIEGKDYEMTIKELAQNIDYASVG